MISYSSAQVEHYRRRTVAPIAHWQYIADQWREQWVCRDALRFPMRSPAQGIADVARQLRAAQAEAVRG